MGGPDLPDNTNQERAFAAGLGPRIRALAESAGGRREFARKAQIPIDSLNKYIGGMQPSPFVLAKLADTGQVTVDDLLGRAGKNVAESGKVSGEEDPGAGRALIEDFVAIPRLEVRASAGLGRAALPAEAVLDAQVAFRRSWLRSLGVSPPNAEFLLAQGDSMEPTIRDGDLILVDRGYGEVVNGKIYVLVVGGLVLVKRLQLLAVGGVMLLSDNDRYPPETVRRSEMDTISIEARVAWYGRAL